MEWDGHVIDIHTEEDWGDLFPLRQASTHAKAREISRLEGCFERPTSQVEKNGFYQVRREAEGHEIVNKAFYTYVTNALATSTKTEPVSHFSSEFLDTLSTVIFSHKQDNFQDDPRVSRSLTEGRDGCEEPRIQLDTGVCGNGVEKILYLLKG